MHEAAELAAIKIALSRLSCPTISLSMSKYFDGTKE